MKRKLDGEEGHGGGWGRGAWRWMGKRGMEVDEERGAWRWMKREGHGGG